MESPYLVDVWTVDSSRRDELLRRIGDVMRDVVVGQPGFVSAQVYESNDGGAVMVSICMRTVKDRQDLSDSGEVQSAVRELRAIAQSHMRLYRLVESFGESD